MNNRFRRSPPKQTLAHVSGSRIDGTLNLHARTGIGKALREHGLTFTDIKLIVITHAHVDHAGSAGELRTLSGAPGEGEDREKSYGSADDPIQAACTTTHLRDSFQ